MSSSTLERAHAAYRQARIHETLALLATCEPSDEVALLELLARSQTNRSTARAAEELWASATSPRARVEAALIRGGEDWLVRAEGAAAGYPELELRTAVARVELDRRAGRLDTAAHGAAQALQRAITLQDPHLIGLAEDHVGRVAFFNNDYVVAEDAYRRAVAQYRLAGSRLAVLGVELSLATICASSGRAAEALEILERLTRFAEQEGWSVAYPQICNLQGECLRQLGEPARAVLAYERALALSPGNAICHGSLSAALIELGRYAEAEEQARRAVANSGREVERVILGSALLVTAAARGDVADFDQRMDAIERASASLGFIETDSARLASIAATHLADHPARAVRAHDLALRSYRGALWSERAAEETAALGALAAAGAPVQVGRYLLERALGRGAMGEVWRARAPGGTAVALKVLTGRGARMTARRVLVQNELRTVASLDHDNIVALLDHGLVGETAEVMTGGRLAEGSPFLVLELVEGGTLDERCGQLPWPAARNVLLQLLDALAHAHARGVVHLDVKPANVLVGLHGVALGDFGVARALRQGRSQTWGGTPWFMAPEQFRTAWVDIGPWTDLYALGGLAWALLTGAPPYDGPTLEHIRDRHLAGVLPPFRPAQAVPPEVEEWLRTLLRRAPRQRFARAADAALALSRLPVMPPASARPYAPAVASAASTTFTHTLLLDVEPVAPPKVEGAVLHARPAIPAIGRVTQVSTRESRTGATLLALRGRRLVGRDAEQDLLWTAFRKTAQSARGRSIVIGGAAGLGRSALVRWFSERTHEVGSAVVLGSRPTDAEPYLDLIARVLTWDPDVGRRVLTELGVDAPIAIDALGDLASPEDGLVDLARALAVRRPVVITLDGAPVPRGGDGIPGAVLAVATAPAGGLELGPLDEDASRLLVAALLPLEADVVWEISRASGGSPMLAELAVALLVAREAVVPGPVGLQLRPRLSVDAPTDLGAGWRERAALLERGVAAPGALAAAARLGRLFVRGEWKAEPILEARALDAGVLVADAERLAFAQQSARAALRSG